MKGYESLIKRSPDLLMRIRMAEDLTGEVTLTEFHDRVMSAAEDEWEEDRVSAYLSLVGLLLIGGGTDQVDEVTEAAHDLAAEANDEEVASLASGAEHLV